VVANCDFEEDMAHVIVEISVERNNPKVGLEGTYM
jgi:hypothetical protein